MIENPYAGVDFGGVQVHSISHTHDKTGERIADLVAAGYRHLAISNYHPENPASSYPLTNLPLIDEEDVTADMIGCPNAEYHSMTNAQGHFGGIGCELVCDPGGWGGTWQSWLDAAESALKWPDKGGFIINHPWHNNTIRPTLPIMLAMLDHTPAVLGIEIYNHMLEHWYTQPLGWALDVWHDILVTGRRCYGSASLDHWGPSMWTDHPQGKGDFAQIPRGRNILLLPASYAAMSRAQREEACAAAYRAGHWYAALDQSTLALTGFEADDDEVKITLSESCDITFVWGEPGDTSPRTSGPVSASSAAFPVPDNAVYVRVEAWKNADEVVITQPVRYMDTEDVDPAPPDPLSRAKRLLLLS